MDPQEHDDVIKWKHFLHYWPFVRGIHRRIPLTKASDAELWCFRWFFTGTNGWVNNRHAGDLRRHGAHYDVTVMINFSGIWITQQTNENAFPAFRLKHYNDVIMTTMASQITSLTVVYSTVYSDADQRKHQSSASLAFVWGIHRDRWIPRTKGQLREKCFHLMTSSWKCPLFCLGIIV